MCDIAVKVFYFCMNEYYIIANSGVLKFEVISEFGSAPGRGIPFEN